MFLHLFGVNFKTKSFINNPEFESKSDAILARAGSIARERLRMIFRTFYYAKSVFDTYSLLLLFGIRISLHH